MSIEFDTFGVGGKFPRSIPTQMGAISDFLRDNGSFLYVFLDNINATELKAFTEGSLYGGLLVDAKEMVFIWQFKLGFKPILTMEGRFDIRRIPDPEIPELTQLGKDRLVINVIVVDSATKLIANLRSITLPPQLTEQFITAAKAQLAGEVGEKLNFLHLEPYQLAEKTVMYKLGE